MQKRRLIALAALAVLIPGNGFGMYLEKAQQPTIKRTELQRHDLSVSGREIVQARIEFGPGMAFGRHTHPAEEVVYVLEGSLEFQVDGKLPVTLRAGDVLFVPAQTTHTAKNVGTTTGAELATGHGHHFAATEEVTMLPSSAPVPFQVVGIAGSLRQGSYNRALLRAAQQLAPAAVQIRIHDLSEIPFFNEDVERAGIPSAVARLRAAMT